MKKRILIVDDEPQIVMLLRTSLERSGYEVEEAFSGADAHQRMKEGAYDLMLLDFFLPDTIGGAEFCKKVRSESKQLLPIIIITGFSSRDPESFISEGASDVIFKPIHHDDLVEKVQRLLF